jgi:hypothetical protein
MERIMIYGDPYRFAVQVDKASAWTLPGDIWINGIFSVYLEGKRVFDIVDTMELRTTVGVFTKSDLDSLEENNMDISKEEIIRNAHACYILGTEELYKGVRDLTCTIMGDHRFYLYFVKTKQYDRIIWSDDDRKTAHESRLEPGTVWNVINSLKDFSFES